MDLSAEKLKDKILLIDGLGGLVSALCLGVLLPSFQSFIGLPLVHLYYLASVALVFCCYSLTGFALKKEKNWLSFIAISNLMYCLLTIGFLYHFREQVTLWGYLYFIGEILIVLFLVKVEKSVIDSY